MTPERDSNRLPLRAGAMLLLAVAIIFVGLGWHSAVTTDSSPEADLRAAAASATTSTSATPSTSASPRVGAPSASAGESSASASGPLVCVFNAGTISGLAVQVTDELKSKGYRTSAPGNLATSSITENTVFYTSSQRTQAQQIASDLSGGASVDVRPSAFTQCRGGIAVVVLTR
jgi:hypothetical protein